LQKIGDSSAGPRIVFLVRDLQEKVQIATIETIGLLRNREAVPDLLKVYNQPRSDKVRRAAITALAMMPTAETRSIFARALVDKDDAVRAAAAEGFARLHDAKDAATLEKAFGEERKMAPRLANAFALIAMGKVETTEFAPLPYLLNALNSRSYRAVVEAYLTELARNQAVRSALYPYLKSATKEEKLGIVRILAASGDRESVPHLEILTKDQDTQVAQESIRAVRTLRARLP
jgi:HEAT repeat protein